MASGDNSVAGGFAAQAVKNQSIAIGQNITANTIGEVVLGRYNTPVSANNNWSTSDPLFTLGNGSSSVSTNNAFQILKNGNATLDGTLRATSFVGDGSGLTGITTTATLNDGDVTSAKIYNATIVNEDISSSAAIDLSKISGLTDALDGKQSTITNDGLTIAKTSGLQDALDAKAPKADPSFSGTVNVSALKWNGETDTDGKVLISDTEGNILLEDLQEASTSNSGLVSINNQSFSGKKTFTSDIEAKRYILTKNDITSASTTNIFLNYGNVFSVNLTTTIATLNMNSLEVGTYIIKFVQDATGNHSVTFPSNWKWSGGTVPTVTVTAGQTDIVTLIYDGSTFYAAISQNF
jgi:hypothetical protein